MTTEVKSTNPMVKAIVAGTAPQAACMAAARGMLPLSQADLVEALVALRSSDQKELSEAANATLESQESDGLLHLSKDPETASTVLSYLAGRTSLDRAIHEAIILNKNSPDEAIANLATLTADGQLLELITVNQQRLIRAPAIIDAVINNSDRTTEAERRAKETRREFFEKARGAQQIAGELRAQGRVAAAEFMESAESVGTENGIALEDAWTIAQHLEVSDVDIDDSWLVMERIEEFFDESYEQRLANVERIIGESTLDGDVTPERISLIRQLIMMSVKDRIKFAMKGDREARGILIRDSNRVVAAAVVHNPRLTDREVENIAAMRTVSDEVLRLIAMNRGWARSYSIIHNLVRNPRTPIATAMTILPRIRAKDLTHISQNRNVPDSVRRQAYRLIQTREGH
jgi:hypothetical protein